MSAKPTGVVKCSVERTEEQMKCPHMPACDLPCGYSSIFVPLTHEPIIQPNHMKQLYTSLLTGAALLVAGAVSAQNPAKMDQVGHQRIATVRPLGHASSFRGTQPPNDNCSGAVNQNLAIGGSVTFTGDNTGATDTPPDTLGIPQVWETFTTTECANLQLSYCGTTPAFGNAFLALFVDCPFSNFVGASSFNQTTCPDGNVTILYEGVPAGQYYYAVMADDANNAVGPYTITVSATPCSAAPPNDDCAGAIPLPVGTWCNFSTYASTGATESLPGILCNGATGNANDDVWFSFVATNANMSIGVQGSDDGDGNVNTGYDAVVELFEGACPGTSIACADATFNSEPEEIAATGLTVGNTYYVRTYHYFTGTPSLASFGICVVEGGSINIGIEENATAAEWSIYPNPGTGVFNIQYNGASTTVSIEVIDITGRVVYTQQTSMAAGTNHSIDLSGVATGNYNVRLTANGVRSEQRLAVK
jgi:hypothetical protein